MQLEELGSEIHTLSEQNGCENKPQSTVPLNAENLKKLQETRFHETMSKIGKSARTNSVVSGSGDRFGYFLLSVFFGVKHKKKNSKKTQTEILAEYVSHLESQLKSEIAARTKLENEMKELKRLVSAKNL